MRFDRGFYDIRRYERYIHRRHQYAPAAVFSRCAYARLNGCEHAVSVFLVKHYINIFIGKMFIYISAYLVGIVTDYYENIFYAGYAEAFDQHLKRRPAAYFHQRLKILHPGRKAC